LCCCCPRREDPAAVVEAVVPPPNLDRLRIMRLKRELTGLHHPLTAEERQNMVCSICMEPNVNIMVEC
jgi:hypothetical protein